MGFIDFDEPSLSKFSWGFVLKKTWLLISVFESALLLGLAAAVLLFSSPGRAQIAKQFVDTQLVIAVDTSGSVTNDEYETQKQGVVEAFSDPQVLKLMRMCIDAGVAVTYVEWAGSCSEHQVAQVVPWRWLQTEADIEAFRFELQSVSRSYRGETDIVSALTFVSQIMRNSPFTSYRKIISFSGDGYQSFAHGALEVVDASFMASDGGETIVNGIAIDTSAKAAEEAKHSINPGFSGESALKLYYESQIQQGPGSFVIQVDSFEEYGEAIKEQLFRALNSCMS